MESIAPGPPRDHDPRLPRAQPPVHSRQRPIHPGRVRAGPTRRPSRDRRHRKLDDPPPCCEPRPVRPDEHSQLQPPHELRAAPQTNPQLSMTALVPLGVLLVVVAVDLWIYQDAKAHRDRGRPVMVTIGSITIDAPETWLAGCLMLSVVFLPLYFVARDAS